MQELSSKPFIANLHLKLKQRSTALIDGKDIEPHLAVVLVGEDEQSLAYVGMKEQRSKEDGIILSLYHLAADVSFEEVQGTVKFLSQDPEVHGIIIQLPLPKRFTNEQLEALIQLIPSHLDVDGLRGDWQKLSYTKSDTGSLASPQTAPLPPMILSVMSLLNHYSISIEGKKVVIVGKGRLVGMPLFQFFQKLGVDVAAVDEETPDILSITKEADILITGTGEPDLITYQWVKEGAVVIDCAGDVHWDSVSQIASALTPAKGAIGPLTVLWLLSNVVNSAEGVSHD
jgi:methylenetetrahydrofolate dehydrogenase (NADP+)/methenyltetrahydrofolate cyclohydrolase